MAVVRRPHICSTILFSNQINCIARTENGNMPHTRLKHICSNHSWADAFKFCQSRVTHVSIAFKISPFFVRKPRSLQLEEKVSVGFETDDR